MNDIDSNKKSINQELITNYMYLGLLPFFACAFGPWVLVDYETQLVDLFKIYSNIVLVFLAGALWSISLFKNIEHRQRHSHAAIIFSLWPLFSVTLPDILVLGFMALGFLLILLWEKCFINPIYPLWYQTLRHKITFIVVACHMLAMWNVLRE